jgi:hypothetical protein
MFGTDGTLWGISHSAFERAAKSIATRWFVQSMTRYGGLYRFVPLDCVTPYVLCSLIFVLLDDG